MFGLTAGFDIVIGNPPYVPLQKNGSELANRYQNDSFRAFARTGDLYVLFCERGVGLLRPSIGILAYITSNSWLKAKYGKKLRRFLSNGHTPLRLLEMGGDVFENAIVDSSVVIVRHGGHGAPLPAVDLDLLPNDMSFPELPDAAWGEVRPSKEEPWSIMSLDEWRVMDKMRAVGTPLKDWDDISIYYGIRQAITLPSSSIHRRRSGSLPQIHGQRRYCGPSCVAAIFSVIEQPGRALWLIATLPSLSIDIDDVPSSSRIDLLYLRT